MKEKIIKISMVIFLLLVYVFSFKHNIKSNLENNNVNKTTNEVKTCVNYINEENIIKTNLVKDGVENSEEETLLEDNSSSKTNTTTSKNDEKTQETKQNINSSIVYVTKTGKKYHKAGCSYLKESKIEMTLENAKNKGYTACKKCY